MEKKPPQPKPDHGLRNTITGAVIGGIFLIVSVLIAFNLGESSGAKDLAAKIQADNAAIVSNLKNIENNQADLKSLDAQHLWEVSRLKLTMMKYHSEDLDIEEIASANKLKGMSDETIGLIAWGLPLIELDENENIKAIPASLKPYMSTYKLSDTDLKVYKRVTKIPADINYIPVQEHQWKKGQVPVPKAYKLPRD